MRKVLLDTECHSMQKLGNVFSEIISDDKPVSVDDLMAMISWHTPGKIH